MVLSFCPIISQYPPSYQRESYTFTQIHRIIFFVTFIDFVDVDMDMDLVDVDMEMHQTAGTVCSVRMLKMLGIKFQIMWTVDESLTF